MVTVTGWQFAIMPPLGLNDGPATWGIQYEADDWTAEVIQPVLNATALRTVPCGVEVTATVPLEAAIRVPLLSVGAVPSSV
jgi:hypothetical protein